MKKLPSSSPPPARKLLRWFDRAARDLPWRKSRDPYPVWLSEIMLQQTQVATVIPYFNRFLARFPTVRALASAPLESVLKIWAGLGYYSRARNLHRAARIIARDRAGSFPRTLDALQSLPGIGRYTAGAVASIAFDVRAPILDGNVARVLVRLFDLDLDPKSAHGRARLWTLAEAILPSKRCGDFNQALMELGATICIPGSAPLCEICPLRADCRARANRTVQLRPRPAARKMPRAEQHLVAAIHHAGRFLFTRRPSTGLWANLWELPTIPLGDAPDPPRSMRMLLKRLGLAAATSDPQPLSQTTRQLTHRTITFTTYSIRLQRLPRAPSRAAARWLRLEAARTIPISTAMKKILPALAEIA